jgi:hypothetical protein
MSVSTTATAPSPPVFANLVIVVSQIRHVRPCEKLKCANLDFFSDGELSQRKRNANV